MKKQLLLTDSHKKVIRACLKVCGYPAALAKALSVGRSIFTDWDKEGKAIGYDTWVAIVQYARDNGIVGPFFDVITLSDPPGALAVDKEVEDAAWMLQNMPREERAGLLDSIAAAYGRYAMKKKDSDAI